MRLLTQKHRNGKIDLVLQLGLGLVGRSVFDEFIRKGFNVEKIYNLKWDDKDNVKSRFKTAALDMTRQAGIGRVQIHLIWTAGKAGFGAKEGEFEAENFAFDQFLYLAKELSGPYELSIHYMSSAGGLFEAQRFVSHDTLPEPKRPYGVNKLHQERKLETLSESMSVHIYRPSSVYGYSGEKGRMGLVVALVQKGLQGVPVHIYGRSDTLRDFVFVDDIAKFLFTKILSPQSGKYFLASGKPTCMYEILKLTQAILKKRLYFRYIAAGNNAEHMSFSRGALPEGWRATPLPVGIKKTVQKIERAVL